MASVEMKNEGQTNHHALDQTYVTSSCIRGQTLDSQSCHHVSFQFRKKSCQTNWFQKFPWLHYDSRLVRLAGTEGATEKYFRQKLCEIPVMKESAALLKINFVTVILFCYNCMLSLYLFLNSKKSFSQGTPLSCCLRLYVVTLLS